jgi:hypothetical protein
VSFRMAAVAFAVGVAVTTVVLVYTSLGAMLQASSHTASANDCRGNCDVAVKVVPDASADGCHLELTDTSQADLYVPNGYHGVKIKWGLDDASSATHKFDETDALRLKTSDKDQLVDRKVEANGRAFKVTDKNDQTGTLKITYGLVVHSKADPTKTCKIDPYIHNIN